MFDGAATRRVDLRPTHSARAPWLPMVCATLAACAFAGSATAVADTAATAAPAAPASAHLEPLRTPSHPRAGGTLDHRLKVLAKALDLDARQEAELRRILESQRQAVTKIWSDPALLSAERVPATRAAEERTAEQIRAILNDEQKKRYNPPKPQGAEAPPPNVEAWMERQALRSE
jgi:hypothetical protein